MIRATVLAVVLLSLSGIAAAQDKTITIEWSPSAAPTLPGEWDASLTYYQTRCYTSLNIPNEWDATQPAANTPLGSLETHSSVTVPVPSCGPWFCFVRVCQPDPSSPFDKCGEDSPPAFWPNAGLGPTSSIHCRWTKPVHDDCGPQFLDLTYPGCETYIPLPPANVQIPTVLSSI